MAALFRICVSKIKSRGRGGGFGAGLALAIGLGIWIELRDKSIRTEKDASAAMDLPLLVSLPWLVEDETVATNGNGKRHFWKRDADKDRERIGV